MASDVEAVGRVIWNMILRFAGFAKEANWKPVLSSHGLSLRKHRVFFDFHRSVLSSHSKFAQFSFWKFNLDESFDHLCSFGFERLLLISIGKEGVVSISAQHVSVGYLTVGLLVFAWMCINVSWMLSDVIRFCFGMFRLYFVDVSLFYWKQLAKYTWQTAVIKFSWYIWISFVAWSLPVRKLVLVGAFVCSAAVSSLLFSCGIWECSWNLGEIQAFQMNFLAFSTALRLNWLNMEWCWDTNLHFEVALIFGCGALSRMCFDVETLDQTQEHFANLQPAKRAVWKVPCFTVSPRNGGIKYSCRWTGLGVTRRPSGRKKWNSQILLSISSRYISEVPAGTDHIVAVRNVYHNLCPEAELAHNPQMFAWM